MVQAILRERLESGALKEQFLRAYRWMLLARIAEEKFASLYRSGKMPGSVFVGRGQEALSASVGVSLRKGDVIAPLIRDQAARLAFCETLLDAARAYYGSPLGMMRGRDGNVHRGRPKEGYLAMISHLGAMIPAVAGVLLAHRMKGIAGTVGVASLGEGGTSTGAFHEGLNLAAVERLPLVMVVANNQYAYSTPTSRQFACDDLVDKAIGYGITGHSVDGTELGACLITMGEAVGAARQGGGPQLVVASLLRLAGHGEHDDAGYIDPRLKQSHCGRDCVDVAESSMLREGWCDAGDLSRWREDAHHQVEEAVTAVQHEPAPDPDKEDWCALASKRLRDGFAAE